MELGTVRAQDLWSDQHQSVWCWTGVVWENALEREPIHRSKHFQTADHGKKKFGNIRNPTTADLFIDPYRPLRDWKVACHPWIQTCAGGGWVWRWADLWTFTVQLVDVFAIHKLRFTGEALRRCEDGRKGMTCWCHINVTIKTICIYLCRDILILTGDSQVFTLPSRVGWSSSFHSFKQSKLPIVFPCLGGKSSVW